jgi:transposase
VLGALDAISHQLVTVTNDTYINAHSLCQLMQQLRRLTPTLPIVLILDNARYQKCTLVWLMAHDLKIELLYLPPYSPNLNLIERLWKFVKKKCLYSFYYADFAAFSKAITTCLEHTQDIYIGELNSLLTLNFQSFEDVTLLSSMPS